MHFSSIHVARMVSLYLGDKQEKCGHRTNISSPLQRQLIFRIHRQFAEILENAIVFRNLLGADLYLGF